MTVPSQISRENEPLLLDDLDGVFDDDFEVSPAPNIEREEGAELHLRCLSYWTWQKSRSETHAQREMERIQRRLDGEREKIGKRIAWHEQGLRAFLWRSGQKTLRLIHGTLKRVAGREKIEVQDVDLFTSWAEPDPPGLIRVKSEPNKVACMKYVKATGEIPPGMDLVVGEDSFCVKFNEGEYR